MPPYSHPAVGASGASEHLAPGAVSGVPALPTEEERSRRRRKWLLLLLLLLSAVPSILTTSISVSMFRERSLGPSDAFGAVEVDVSANPPVLIIAAGMLPGDAVTGSLRIDNLGERPIRYSVTSTSSHHGGPRLAEALVAEVRTEGTGCPSFDGTVLYLGPLSEARIGDPAQGGDPGDRRLDAGGGELLCVAVTLPRPAGDLYQSASATTAFTVIAEEDQ